MFPTFFSSVFLIALWFILPACAPNRPAQSSSSNPVAIQTRAAITVPTQPFSRPAGSSWVIGENPSASSDDATFHLHALLLTGKQTTIIYSISGKEHLDSNSLNTLEMSDSQGKSYKVVDAHVLAELDDMQIVSATFPSPEYGATSLKLRLQPFVGDAFFETIIAQVVPEGELPYWTPEIRYLIPRDGYREQMDFRVSFNAFAPYTGDLAYKQENPESMTSEELLADTANKALTPEKPEDMALWEQNPITAALSEGKPILGDLTIRIENLKSSEVRFLYVVFPEDGGVKTSWLQ